MVYKIVFSFTVGWIIHYDGYLGSEGQKELV